MNKKERIEVVLAGEQVDRVPFAFLDAGAWASDKTGKTYRENLEEDDAGAAELVQAFKEAGVDMMSAGAAYFVAHLDAIGCKADIDCSGKTIDV